MKKTIVCFLMALVAVMSLFSPTVQGTSYAKNFEMKISAKSALLIDYQSGEVIYEKNADDRLPVASMTKLASLAVIFDFMSKGIVKENDLVVVSKAAANVGGSSAFLDAGSMYLVIDLIKTIIMASANDSTVAMAEHIAGSEGVFVSKMNKFAQELKLENTHFENSTGLPVQNHYSSARDMAEIYKHVCNNEIYKKYSKLWMDDFMHPSGRRTGLVNTNKLVKTYDGIEGGKTGYTDSAKFCLTASAKRGEMRLVGVVIGVADSKTRFKEMSNLFDYGFANYQSKLIASNEVPVTVAKFKNAKDYATVYTARDIFKFMSKDDELKFSTDFQLYDKKAPLSQGDVVGKLYVFDQNNMVVDEVELVVRSNVEAIGFKESLNKIVHVW